jgi:signal transduction histidine kinase
VIQGDSDKIMLALHNLVGNALKYTPSGGEVKVNVAVAADEWTVEVADTGVGIAANEVDRVFEKFYRSEDPRVVRMTGSGLGLALAREIARLHGGDITVRSELDKGSSFTLTIPMTDQESG